MSRKKVEKTAQFTAVDGNGKPYTIIEFTDFIDVSTLKERDKWAPGLKSYKLADGTHCNLLDDGTFEPLGKGIKLRRR